MYLKIEREIQSNSFKIVAGKNLTKYHSRVYSNNIKLWTTIRLESSIKQQQKEWGLRKYKLEDYLG